MKEEIHNPYVTNGICSIDTNFKTSFLFYGNDNKEELLKINEEGFWIRGVKVEQGENEAKEVYQGFLNLIGYHYETM